MINGVHAIIFTRDAQKDRVFFRDVLDLPSVDAGDGWLIFLFLRPSSPPIPPTGTPTTSCT
jgi:catechol 2,3-dioxygenase-like lactoylglutathione lyase family enzyme